jgi:cobalamin biosynthesis Mg chelatase CobN
MEGTIMGRTLHQIFVKTTPSTLPNGMCGGPVLIPHQDIQIPINEDNNNNNNNNNRNDSSSTSSGSSNGRGYSESSNCSTTTSTTSSSPSSTSSTTTTTNVSGKKKRQAVNVSKLNSYDGMEGNIRTPLAICGMIEGMIMIYCLFI